MTKLCYGHRQAEDDSSMTPGQFQTPDRRWSATTGGGHILPRHQRVAEGSFREARAALRLQRSVLPDRAVQLLADEVVVRLAKRFKPEVGSLAPANVIATDVFCNALISDDSDAAMAMIRQEKRDGLSLEAIYLGTLSDAARRLGEMWEDDNLSFLQMSVAAGRIFAIMRHMRSQIVSPTRDATVRQALFATVPGELHTLGVTMAADMFRDRGWEIDLRTAYEHEELLASITDRPYRIIGLSAGHPSTMLALTRLVVALRITHPQAHIIVSGRIVAELPDINLLIRADSVLGAQDDAVAHMDRLFAQA